MMNVKEKLVDFKSSVAKGDVTIKDLQRALTQLLLSTELPNVEKMAKKSNNDLELVIYTLNPSNQVEEALKVLDEVIAYLVENVPD